MMLPSLIPTDRMPNTRVRKAVIPAAGLGTRFLPATKVVPKELLPIAGRPIIQYAVEEAAASGIETVILVIGPGKELITEHFRPNVALENTLASRGWTKEARDLHRIADLVEIKTVWQAEPIGLANAIAVAEPAVNEEPFAVILPDALIDSGVPCTRQLIDSYSDSWGCLVATQPIKTEEVERFGIVEVELGLNPGSRLARVTRLVERPAPGTTQSRMGIFGRYILSPRVFSKISKLSPGRGGELQLTDALSLLACSEPVYALQFEGEHFDAGSKAGFIQATLRYALKDPALSGSVIECLSNCTLA